MFPFFSVGVSWRVCIISCLSLFAFQIHLEHVKHDKKSRYKAIGKAEKVEVKVSALVARQWWEAWPDVWK